MASGLVFVSGSKSLWFFQQTPLTAWSAPDNYVLRYVGLRRSAIAWHAVGRPTHLFRRRSPSLGAARRPLISQPAGPLAASNADAIRNDYLSRFIAYKCDSRSNALAGVSPSSAREAHMHVQAEDLVS